MGTGKYRDLQETQAAIQASGAEIVTFALRRSNLGQIPVEPNLLDIIPPDRYTLLPNTAGCYSAEEAIRTRRVARELLDGHDLVKLEVLGDEKTLFPDRVETYKATEVLIKENFKFLWPGNHRSSIIINSANLLRPADNLPWGISRAITSMNPTLSRSMDIQHLPLNGLTWRGR